MDDKTKKIAIIAVAVVAVVAAVFSAFNSMSAPGGGKGEVVGSLEGGVNKATGMPLDPPKDNNAAPTGDSMK